MKGFLQRLGLAVAVCVLLLCVEARAQSSPAASGGTVVIAAAADPGHLNPAISTAGPLHAVAGSLYNGLVALDAQGEPKPDLAKSWQISPDGLTVSFALERSARWHDGRPFTSADVKFSVEQVLLKYHARARAGLGPVLLGVEAPDPHTAVFRLKRPHPALLRQLDVTEAPMVAAHIYREADVLKASANLAPIGTGPFRFDSYRRDDQIVLLRNRDYFKPGLPHLDRIVFRIIPDPNTQINALIAGEVDMLPRISASDIERVAGRGVRLFETTSGPGGANCIMTLSFNLQRPAISDQRVREAFARIIDRGQILKLVAFDQGRIAAAPISSGIPWAHRAGTLDRYSVDTDAAGRLLDEAGLTRAADGLRATFDILLFPAFARYSEVLRQNLAKVGVALRVRTMDPATFGATVFAKRDFDLALISYCNGTDPEIGVRRMYHSTAIGPVPFSNAAGYADSETDRLFDVAAASASQSDRTAAYHAIQVRVADALPYWWLVETDFVSAWRSGFEGFEPWTSNFAERARRAP